MYERSKKLARSSELVATLRAKAAAIVFGATLLRKTPSTHVSKLFPPPPTIVTTFFHSLTGQNFGAAPLEALGFAAARAASTTFMGSSFFLAAASAASTTLSGLTGAGASLTGRVFSAQWVYGRGKKYSYCGQTACWNPSTE